MENKKLIGLIVTGIVVVFAIILFFNSFAIVPTGYTGVRVTFGQVSDTPVASGFNWKVPFFQSIKKINNKQQDKYFEGQVFSETDARTTIIFENVTVTYTINGAKSAWIYANINDYENTLLSSGVVSSAIKSSSKTLSDTDATNRAKIEPLVQEALQVSLDGKFGEDVIYINKVIISNIDFEATYQQAIADKQNTQLAYEKQQIENQKAIEKAQADAKVAKEQAQGVADALLIKAQAEAEANKLLEQSLSEKVLSNRFYDTWNGELPKVTGGDTGLMLPSEILSDTESTETTTTQ